MFSDSEHVESADLAKEDNSDQDDDEPLTNNVISAGYANPKRAKRN